MVKYKGWHKALRTGDVWAQDWGKADGTGCGDQRTPTWK